LRIKSQSSAYCFIKCRVPVFECCSTVIKPSAVSIIERRSCIFKPSTANFFKSGSYLFECLTFFIKRCSSVVERYPTLIDPSSSAFIFKQAPSTIVNEDVNDIDVKGHNVDQVNDSSPAIFNLEHKDINSQRIDSRLHASTLHSHPDQQAASSTHSIVRVCNALGIQW
jgi:hypothetical protein